MQTKKTNKFPSSLEKWVTGDLELKEGSQVKNFQQFFKDLQIGWLIKKSILDTVHYIN